MIMIENVFSAHRSDNTARDVTIQEKNADGNVTPISYDMGNSKSNTKFPVATKISFEASCIIRGFAHRMSYAIDRSIRVL